VAFLKKVWNLWLIVFRLSAGALRERRQTADCTHQHEACTTSASRSLALLPAASRTPDLISVWRRCRRSPRVPINPALRPQGRSSLSTVNEQARQPGRALLRRLTEDAPAYLNTQNSHSHLTQTLVLFTSRTSSCRQIEATVAATRLDALPVTAKLAHFTKPSL
jgi:hypothetical protein